MKTLVGADVNKDNIMVMDWFDNNLAPVMLSYAKFPDQNVITVYPGFKKARSYLHPYEQEVLRDTFPFTKCNDSMFFQLVTGITICM